MDFTNDNELKELARQLRCPDGDTGIEVATVMNKTNNNIINQTINSLAIKKADSILEIGPGNGSHIAAMMKIDESISYSGIDISETMILEAKKRNTKLDNVSFQLTDGESIPFKDNTFDKVFTVNTIYFWKNHLAYAIEIARVMNNGGILAIGFVPKSTMQHIPFAKYGFAMQDVTSVTTVLEKAGLRVENITTDVEVISSNDDTEIKREFVVLTASKQ